MPRIAKPAKPVPVQDVQPKAAKLSQPYVKAANGAVITQVLDALAGRSRETALATDELLPLCPSAASVGSLRSTLRTLAGRGEVSTDSWKARGKLRYWWWGAEGAPMNDGHEQNLATLRRLGADDHVAGAGKVIEADDPVSVAAEALNLDAPGTTRFALWDDGQLLLTEGDDMMVLDVGSVRRLADFLESCIGAI